MTPQPVEPPVDEAVFIALLSQIGSDDDALRVDLIDSYLAEATEQVEGLVVATGTGDADSVRSIAHSLRSASALLGAEPLAQLLTEAEQVANTTPADIPLLAAPIQAEFARVVDAFRALRSTSG